ncbi:S8 family peptidase [Dyella tabacisoli]|nr:S8 family serine peptidase [Dyella tabacisoli]
MPSAMPSDRTLEQAQILVMLRVGPVHFRPAADYAGNYLAAPDRAARRRIARQLAHEHGLVLLSDWPMPALNVDCFVMQAGSEASIAQLAQALAADPRVESAQPMHLFHVLGRSDPLYPLQPAAARWHLSELHTFTTGKHVVIAELDSGVEVTHPDLQGQIALTRNFVDDGDYKAEAHGTEVAGIIAAREGNGIGIAGIAPDARLLALRACWQPAPADPAAVCSSFTLAKALQFALQSQAQIFNLSLSGPRDRLLERLLDVALAHEVTVVGAWDETSEGGFPATYPGVLAVAGEGADSRLTGVLRAPAQDIPTTMPGASFGFVTGSSFAAAQVSGLVALLRELSPGIHPVQLRAALTSATALGLAPQRPATIDACAAMANAGGRCACGCGTTTLGPRR